MTGFAFPCPSSQVPRMGADLVENQTGMTERDFIAAQIYPACIQAQLMKSPSPFIALRIWIRRLLGKQPPKHGIWIYHQERDAARMAYAYTDALIAARQLPIAFYSFATSNPAADLKDAR
jgi:hypothetical protein